MTEIREGTAEKTIKVENILKGSLDQCMLQYQNKVLNTSIGNILKYHYQYGFSKYTCPVSVFSRNYFSVSLSILQKKISGQKFEYFIVLKKKSLLEVHNYQLFSCQLSNFLSEKPNCLHY